jgi:hypothetical protein
MKVNTDRLSRQIMQCSLQSCQRGIKVPGQSRNSYALALEILGLVRLEYASLTTIAILGIHNGSFEVWREL